MSIVRVNKTSNYTVLSNYHFKEKKMSLKAKGLLSLMLSLPDTWNYSISGLVALSKDGKDSVMSALAELEKFGYLNRTQMINDKGQFAGVEYNIYEQPQKDLAVAVNQISEKKNSAKQNADYPPQLNTNQLNTIFNKLLYLLNTQDLELIELYQEYIRNRENNKNPLTEKGLERLVARAKKLSKGNPRVEKEILDASIRNNWKDIYAPKEEEIENLHKDWVDDRKAFYGIEQKRIAQNRKAVQVRTVKRTHVLHQIDFSEKF